MGETILRQWLVLAMLPRPPRRIDTASIESRLRDRGIAVHRRTIQRDLLELAEVFPIVADERAKPYGWRWSDDADLALPFGHAISAQAARIDVSLRIRRESATEILERLGAWDHRISDDTSDEAFVIADVALSDSLSTRRLLLGHADEVEILSPIQLRREVAMRAQRVLALHL